MYSDYGIQSILSDDENGAWDEIDAPFLERPTSSALVMPTISANGSVVSSREITSKGDGFLNGDFPVPTFAQSWVENRCLCEVPFCGCDKLRAKVEEHFVDHKPRDYVVVFESDSAAAKMVKVAVLKHKKANGPAVLFLDTQVELSKEVEESLNEVEGVEVIVLGRHGEEIADNSVAEKSVEKRNKWTANDTALYVKILLSIAVVLFFLFNSQKETSGQSTSPVSNVTYSGPPQPASLFEYEIPASMIFPLCHHLDKPEVHVTAHHQVLDTEVVFQLLSEGFQRLWNGLKNLPSLLTRLLGLDRDVFENNSERALRKIELDMDILVEALDEILEEQTTETLHDALYIWNKMGSDIAEPLKSLKYDEKTSSANFLTIIKLEKRLKVVGDKLTAAKRALKRESREKTEVKEKAPLRERNKSRETVSPRENVHSRETVKPRKTVKPREGPHSRQRSHEYIDRMEDRDQQSHEQRWWRKERRGARRGDRQGEIWTHGEGDRKEVWFLVE